MNCNAPSHWNRASLGEVAEILDSRRVPVNAKERAIRQGGVPYYGATGQVGWIDQALFDEELVLLGEDGAPFLDGARPKAYLISGPAWVNNHAHVLRAKSGLSNRFLLHQLNATSFRPFVSGTTRLKLPQSEMRRIPLVVPPVSEQEAIVSEIEKQFTRLDVADMILRETADRLVAHRASVLGTVIREAADRQVRLGDLLREPLRNGHSAKASADPDGIRTLTLSAVTEDDFSENNTKRTSADARKVADLWLEPDDIFIERSNTPELVGTAARYRGEPRFAIFPDLLIRVRVNDAVLPAYLEAVLKAPTTRRYFRQAAQGIAGSMPKISQGDVAALPIPLPSLSEQQRLIGILDRVLTSNTRLQAALQHSVRRSARLRASVLASAFSGSLAQTECMA